MDVQQKLDEIVATVGSARSMPMSASCVVNRAELLAKLDEVREALPGSLAQAQEVLGGREQVVAQAQQEAQRIIESAHAERESLVSGTEIARTSQAEAERILAEARREAEEIRAEADEYVDSKLANFEVVLGKTIGSVDRGREKLLGRDPGDEFDDAPERSSDPQELRNRADAYIEAQFRAFEAVLGKTLEAVGRGRQKLLGHRPIDELAAHMAAQDNDGQSGDYLAGLAVPQQAGEPAAGGYGYRAAAGYQQDPAGVQQDPYGYSQSGPGGYPAGDGWGTGGYPGEGYRGDTGYDWQSQGGYDPAAGSGGHGDQLPDSGGYTAGYAPGGGVLDETSLFDTSVIDRDQLRRYEQGR